MRAVWHVAGLGNWRSVVCEQLEVLEGAEIREVEVSVVGNAGDFLLQHAPQFRVKADIFHQSDNVKLYERPALDHVEKLAKSSDEPILYFHTKGVSCPDDQDRALWRGIMNEHVVGRWRENVAKLGEFDCVGVNWQTSKSRPHFSGNFWISTAAHIRRLPPFRKFYRNRYSCEFWIGSVAGVRPHSLVCKNIQWWAPGYDWSVWRK